VKGLYVAPDWARRGVGSALRGRPRRRSRLASRLIRMVAPSRARPLRASRLSRRRAARLEVARGLAAPRSPWKDAAHALRRLEARQQPFRPAVVPSLTAWLERINHRVSFAKLPWHSRMSVRLMPALTKELNRFRCQRTVLAPALGRQRPSEAFLSPRIPF